MSAPLRIYIVDDEAPARTRLRSLLEELEASLPNRVVGEAENGREALDELARVAVDIVLLDIRMPVMDGLTMARHLARLETPPAVIFVTAYDQHAVEAFEIGALDYLMKPVRTERLVAALGRARRLSDEDDTVLARLAPRRHLTVSDRGRVWLVPIEDVLYLRAELKYVTLRTRDHEYVLNESLTKLEEEFSREMLRIHRNCLVNRQQLAGFEMTHGSDESGWVARLRDWPEALPVSRRQIPTIKAFRDHPHN
jgi:two-component system response regulator AlgR